MPLTKEHMRLAVTIDQHVKRTLAESGTEALLVSLYDYMGMFKQLLDTLSPEDMDVLCARYDGFYRFAQLLEHLAQGMADGTIPVPE